MVCKEDVVNWFKALSASNRIDTMCTLMDHCISFELRFLGAVIENLGKKDFHEFRDAEHKANHFSGDHPTDRVTLLNRLSEPPPLNPNSHYNNVHLQNPSANNFSQNSHQNFSNNVANDTSASRPSPTHSTERKTRSPPGGGQAVPPPHFNDSHAASAAVINTNTEPVNKAGQAVMHTPNSRGHDEDGVKSDSSILTDDFRRRKLITYLSLLNGTNRDGAKAYFEVMTEIEDMLNILGWLEGLSEVVLEEMALLYTMGNNHPAFTFDERTFLGNVMLRFQNHINKVDSGKGFLPSYVIPQSAGCGYYFLPHIPAQGQAPPGNNSTPENSRPPVTFTFSPYPPHIPVFMQYHPHCSQIPQSQQQSAHPYAQNIATIPPPAATNSPVTPTQPLLQQQPVPLSGPSSTSLQQFPKAQQSGSQSQQSSVSTPTRTSSLASAVTAFQSQTNSLDGNESEECAWDSPESSDSPFESPPQSLTPSRSDSPTATQTNTLTQSSVPFPLVVSLPNSQSGVTISCNSIPENLCSTTSIATTIGNATLQQQQQSTRPQNKAIPIQYTQPDASTVPNNSKSLNLLNGIKISVAERKASKAATLSLNYLSNQSSSPSTQISGPPTVVPLPGLPSSGPSTGLGCVSSISSSCHQPQNHSNQSQPFIHSTQSQSTLSGGYSSGNCSVSSPSYHHPASLPLPQQHHSQPIVSVGGSGEGSNSYGNTMKGCISLQPTMQAHSRLKSNTCPNATNAINTSTMLSSPQQMIGQVHVQVQNPPPTPVNTVGVGTHSISSNPPLVAYSHGPLVHGGPPQVNSFGITGYSNVGAPPYGSMSFRSPNQPSLINRTASYIPQHNNSMMNNQMVMKQQDQRSHNLNPSMSQGRPKHNTAAVQSQNTPKRRNNSSTNPSTGSNNVGSNGGNQHSMQNKGEEYRVPNQ